MRNRIIFHSMHFFIERADRHGQKDGLTWTQVSDLNSWNNEVARSYGVRAVPQSYLIDPQGVIVAQNLRGEALEAKLKEIFGE